MGLGAFVGFAAASFATSMVAFVTASIASACTYYIYIYIYTYIHTHTYISNTSTTTAARTASMALSTVLSFLPPLSLCTIVTAHCLWKRALNYVLSS